MKRTMTSLACLSLLLGACGDDDRHDGMDDGGLESAGDSAADEGTDTDGTDDDGNDSYGSPEGELPMCPDTFTVEEKPAAVMFVLDNSGSMKNELEGSSTTRWDELDSTVRDVVDGDEHSYFGLSVFPSDKDENVCSFADDPQVPIGPDSHDAILSQLDAYDSPGGYTPAVDAYKAAWTALDETEHDGRKVIMLVSDGMPDCEEGYESRPEIFDPDLAAEIAAANAAGIVTYVIGIAPGEQTKQLPDGTVVSNHDALNHAAEAGGAARAGDEKYYRADTAEALHEAIDDITLSTACSVELQQAPLSGEAHRTTVSVGGEKFGMVDSCDDDSRGYTVNGNKVELCPDACDAYLGGDEAEVEYVCRVEP